MKLQLQYGNRVIVLPATALVGSEAATALDFRVLFALAAEPSLLSLEDGGASSVAKQLGVSVGDAQAAVAFWRGVGVFGEGTESATSSASTPLKSTPPRLTEDRGLPTYTTAELAGLIESNKDFSSLINACQQTFGKIFNTAEVSIIMGLTDHLGLDGEYILLLLSHCVKMEKKSLRYAEKTALSLFDEGITDAASLEERLRRIELMAGALGSIRTMFGISSRSLTSKEKKMVEAWVATMQYPLDVIRIAYETTVDAIGKASLSYANTILERWYAAGYRTAEDVTAAIEDYRRKKQGGSSFDVDDFFNAALKNTYGDI